MTLQKFIFSSLKSSENNIFTNNNNNKRKTSKQKPDNSREDEGEKERPEAWIQLREGFW